MKIGDKITCVKTYDSQSLEYDRDYIVADINQYGNIQVRQASPPYATLAHYYKPERFVQVKTAKSDKKVAKNTIDFTKSYMTLGGLQVNLLATSQDANFPILGEIFCDGKWSSENWTADGKYFCDGYASDNDLIEPKQSIECNGFEVFVFADKSVHIIGDDINECLNKSQMEKIFKIWNSFP
jgi:hypothetical protein